MSGILSQGIIILMFIVGYINENGSYQKVIYKMMKFKESKYHNVQHMVEKVFKGILNSEQGGMGSEKEEKKNFLIKNEQSSDNGVLVKNDAKIRNEIKLYTNTLNNKNKNKSEIKNNFSEISSVSEGKLQSERLVLKTNAVDSSDKNISPRTPQSEKNTINNVKNNLHLENEQNNFINSQVDFNFSPNLDKNYENVNVKVKSDNVPQNNISKANNNFKMNSLQLLLRDLAAVLKNMIKFS